ncbi:hypothetical protein C8R46DRAFT_1205422 [Mycena filopes]|nr:hypothetical protein C8R46DRAFT_1205422 [Mycena filopes]
MSRLIHYIFAAHAPVLVPVPFPLFPPLPIRRTRYILYQILNALGSSKHHLRESRNAGRRGLNRAYSNKRHPKPARKSTRKVVPVDFDMMRVLGKERAGKVLLVKHKPTSDLYTLKTITKRHVVLRCMAASSPTGKTTTDSSVVKLWWSFHDKPPRSLRPPQHCARNNAHTHTAQALSRTDHDALKLPEDAAVWVAARGVWRPAEWESVRGTGVVSRRGRMPTISERREGSVSRSQQGGMPQQPLGRDGSFKGGATRSAMWMVMGARVGMEEGAR